MTVADNLPASLADGDLGVWSAELIRLKAERRTHEDVIAQLDTDIKHYEGAILNRMRVEGMQRFRFKGQTLYQITRQYILLAANKSIADAIEALRACGLAHLILESYDAVGVKNYITERLAQGEPVPPAVAEAFYITERNGVNVLKSHRDA